MNTIYMRTKPFYKLKESSKKKNAFTCLRLHFAIQVLEIS